VSEFLSVSLSVNRAKGNRLSGRGAAEEDEWKRGERDGQDARARNRREISRERKEKKRSR
jgi:hypothetical protein